MEIKILKVCVIISCYFTRLEWHYWNDSKYIIKNELYKSENKGTLGRPEPLSTLFPSLQEETIIDKLTRPLFVYFKPNIANNLADDSPLGISVFSNALDTLKALDICFDSFMREFALGKKRITVPATAVRTVTDSDGNPCRYFDENDEVYQAFAFEDASQFKIYDNTVELRVEEHISALNAFLAILALQTGLTPGTLSFSMAQGVKTATEVISENSKTFKTIKTHENLIAEAIYRIVDIIITLGRLYDIKAADANYNVSVNFDDSIVQDKAAERAEARQDVRDGLVSKLTTLIKVYGYTEEEAELELLRVQEENKITTEQSFEIFNA